MKTDKLLQLCNNVFDNNIKKCIVDQYAQINKIKQLNESEIIVYDKRFTINCDDYNVDGLHKHEYVNVFYKDLNIIRFTCEIASYTYTYPNIDVKIKYYLEICKQLPSAVKKRMQSLINIIIDTFKTNYCMSSFSSRRLVNLFIVNDIKNNRDLCANIKTISKKVMTFATLMNKFRYYGYSN